MDAYWKTFLSGAFAERKKGAKREKSDYEKLVAASRSKHNRARHGERQRKEQCDEYRYLLLSRRPTLEIWRGRYEPGEARRVVGTVEQVPGENIYLFVLRVDTRARNPRLSRAEYSVSAREYRLVAWDGFENSLRELQSFPRRDEAVQAMREQLRPA